MFAVARDRGPRRARRPSQRAGAARARPARRHEPRSHSTAARSSGASRRCRRSSRSRYDRAFPHTLRLTVVPELPVAVLHRGSRRLAPLRRAGACRAAIPPRTHPGAAAHLGAARDASRGRALRRPRAAAGVAARALALGAPLPGAHRDGRDGARRARRSCSAPASSCASAMPTDVRLKLAIARRACATLPAGAAYLDVSVPGRPVAGTQPSSLK